MCLAAVLAFLCRCLSFERDHDIFCEASLLVNDEGFLCPRVSLIFFQHVCTQQCHRLPRNHQSE